MIGVQVLHVVLADVQRRLRGTSSPAKRDLPFPSGKQYNAARHFNFNMRARNRGEEAVLRLMHTWVEAQMRVHGVCTHSYHLRRATIISS
jgi:hypothetical protein